MRVESRAGRILRHLDQYHRIVEGSPDAPSSIGEISFQEGERCLGVYENSPGKAEESVAVTTQGLHVRRDGDWEFIPYDQIEFVETPQSKVDVSNLMLHLRGDRVSEVPVRGGRGRMRDAWEFLRFLMRVIEDVKRTGDSDTGGEHS